MAITQQTPPEAHDTLNGDSEAVYVDVRTEGEFERGHPAGALNIPVLFFDDAGGPARPNPDFVDVVRRHLDADRTLVVGCQAGGRSQRACEMLEQSGYGKLINVQGGFGGARDRDGNVVVAGWKDSGLPVDSGAPADRCYADLRKKG